MKNYKNKYRNKKVIYKNEVFDSKAELKHIKNLMIKEQQGFISSLEIKPKYMLQESFRDSKGKAIRAITYTPEASYIENSQKKILEIKSKPTITDAYTIRKKLFLKRYPDIELVEIIT